MQRFKDSIDFVSLLDLTDPFLHSQTDQLDETDLDSDVQELKFHHEEVISPVTDESSGEETQEPVIEKHLQPLLPVAEATEPPKSERERRKRRRKQNKKSRNSDSELNSRKIVKEQVNFITLI